MNRRTERLILSLLVGMLFSVGHWLPTWLEPLIGFFETIAWVLGAYVLELTVGNGFSKSQESTEAH